MKNNEIGSEFVLVETNKEQKIPHRLLSGISHLSHNLFDGYPTPTHEEEFSNVMHLYASGRSALDAIIKDIIKDGLKHSVYLPSYCCHTMIEPFVKSGINVFFYCVTVKENGFYCDYQQTNCDIVFLIDYFGFKNINQPSFMDKTIIKDVTHSLFRTEKNFDFSYEFGSIRKWTAIDGGFAEKQQGHLNYLELNNNANNYIEKRKKARLLKNHYLNGGNLEKSKYLLLFNEAEEELEKNYANASFPKDELEQLQNLHIEFIRNQRKTNASVLIETLKSFNIEGIRIINKLTENDCPLFVPIKVEAKYRDSLKQFLVKNNIYTPVHWPLSDLHKISEPSKKIYEEELSLICDQRYSKDDMFREAETINSFFKRT